MEDRLLDLDLNGAVIISDNFLQLFSSLKLKTLGTVHDLCDFIDLTLLIHTVYG